MPPEPGENKLIAKEEGKTTYGKCYQEMIIEDKIIVETRFAT